MFDSHAHMDDRKFSKLDQIITKCKDSGVNGIVNPISSLKSNERILLLSERYPGFIHATGGLDPVHALRESKEKAEKFIYDNNRKLVAIGEIGIDYYWEKEKKEEQKENLKFFLDIAQDLNKPVIIHARDAMADTLQVLTKFEGEVVLHSYAGSKKQVIEAEDRGYYLSFGTSCCFIDNNSLIKTASLDNMVIETDSPYNHPDREKINDPSQLGRIIDLISSLKEENFKNVERITEKNTRKLFGL